MILNAIPLLFYFFKADGHEGKYNKKNKINSSKKKKREVNLVQYNCNDCISGRQQQNLQHK